MTRLLGIRRLVRSLTVVPVAAAVVAASTASAYGLSLVSDVADPGFPTANNRVWSMIKASDGVFLGGTFTAVGGQPRKGLAKLTASGTVTSMRVDVSGWVQTFALSTDGATLYLGGNFNAVAGQKRHNLAAIDVKTGKLLAFAPKAIYKVKGVAVANGRVYATGDETHSYLPADGSEDTKFKVTLDPPSYKPERVGGIGITYAGGKLLLGGWYSAINGVARRNLAAIDPVTGNPTSWSGASPCPPMNFDTSPDGKTIYLACVGGQQTGDGVVALDLASGRKVWQSTGDGDVQDVAEINGVLYAGGHFTQQSGVKYPRLVAFDAATGKVLTWYPAARVNSGLGVWSTLDVNGALWIGGDFTRPTDHLARFS